MKKVLLATSALTLSAGFASADVSMSGTGEQVYSVLRAQTFQYIQVQI